MPETLSPPTGINSYTHTAVDVAIQADINPKTNRITVLFEGNDGLIAFTGTEGAQLTAADSFPVVAGAPFTVAVDAGEDRVNGMAIFTEVSTQPTVVKIISELI